MEYIENNPVIRGFAPDPSILRVGKDYYIATSTFEWMPGVHIYHSQNLVEWDFLTAPLTETLIDLTGVDTSCGIWAPNLTYDGRKFYLVYTIVQTDRNRFKDTKNYLVTSENIMGPWSKPVYLNCSGFDPSLFHEGDKKWLVNMTIDHRSYKKRFSGIDVQEYSDEKNRLVGKVHRIFTGTKLGITEGPNLLKRGEYYYLTCAEGGTGFGHGVTVARSKNLLGHYEADPNNPMMTSAESREYPIQRAGHGQIVSTENGDWYMAHLASRPVEGYSILGRETFLQNISWTDDDWFVLAGGEKLPKSTFLVLKETRSANKKINHQVDFRKETKVAPPFMTLRHSPKHCGITLDSEGLHIQGGNSLSSKYNQGLLARRQQSLSYTAETSLEFHPRSYHHMAGLVCYYNYDNYFYVHISRDEELGAVVGVTTMINKESIDSMPVAVSSKGLHYLRAVVEGRRVVFSCSSDGVAYSQVGAPMDMGVLSDEHVEGNGFTGAVIGIACQDLQGDGVMATFKDFVYKEG